MDSAILLVTMHVTGWFSLGALTAVLRGSHGTLRITTAVTLGMISALFQLLLERYLRGEL